MANRTDRFEKHHPAIWLSDIHLGFRDCKADFLLDFLQHNSCDTLYLLGDVIDFYAIKRKLYWPESHQKVLRRLVEIASNGTEVIYVPGNHDHLIRDFVEQTILGVKIRQNAVHQTSDGRKFLLLHGDQFDNAVRFSRFTKLVGNAAYELLLILNKISFGLRRALKLPYWSLAYFIKNKVKNARKAIHIYEQVVADHTAKLGYDGVICGHIHQPEIRKISGVLYCNDGDWIESCTALVENEQGWLELIHWGDLQQQLTNCRNPDEQPSQFKLPELRKAG